MPKKPQTSPRGSRLSFKPFVVVAVGAGAALFGLLRTAEPAPRSPQALQAEDETRALVDERMALHLQRLRAL